MPQESELLKAVLEKPDDDGPRLAYAEGCAHTDAARTDFIRLQLELAKTAGDTSDPPVFQIARRSANLAKIHGARWCRPMIPPATSCEFFRGFVELAVMPAEAFLQQAPVLFQQAPIRHLVLRAVEGRSTELFLSPHLAGIRSLSLDDCGLTDDDLRRLADSPCLSQLRWLSLVGNEIDFFGINLLARSKSLPALQWANFAGNKINPGEQFSSDQGVIVESWLPDEGKRLEAMNGPIRWLRSNASTTRHLVPDRFRIGS